MLTDREKQQRILKFAAQLKKKPTQSESDFMAKLDQAGIKYMFQKGFIKGSASCIVDFYLPRPHRLCIEIDGGYHQTDEQKSKDAWRDNYLTNERGFKVIRILNSEVEKFDLKTLFE